MLFSAKQKKGPPISKITDRTTIQRTSPLRQNSKIPKHTKSLFYDKQPQYRLPQKLPSPMLIPSGRNRAPPPLLPTNHCRKDGWWRWDGPSALRRTPPPLLGCRWAWLGAPGTRRRRRWEAPPAMPIDSRAVAEAPGGGQKDCVTDSVTCKRSGPVGRPDTHFTNAY